MEPEKYILLEDFLEIFEEVMKDTRLSREAVVDLNEIGFHHFLKFYNKRCFIVYGKKQICKIQIPHFSSS